MIRSKALIILFGFLYLTSSSASEFDELKKKRVINYFKYQAAEVVSNLSSVQEIFQINDLEIDLDTLREEISRTEYSVSNRPLVDNTGSLVDVIGTPRKLILNLNSWIEFQKADQDLRALIIHELLRASGINDDDYLISRPLYSLLAPRSEDSSPSPYCNLRVSKTTTVTNKKRFKGEGFQPLAEGSGISFNSTKQNISFDNAVKDLKEKCEKAGYYGFEYISGQTKMERRNTNGMIRAENKTSIKAYCFKDKLKKRRSRERRKEACLKVNLCQKIYKAAPKGQVSTLDSIGLLKLKKDNRCE